MPSAKQYADLKNKQAKLGAIKFTTDSGKTKASCTLKIGSKKYELFVKADSELINQQAAADAFLTATLIPLMRMKVKSISIDQPVSAKLLANIETIQDIYINWYPKYFSRIKVIAEPSKKTATSAKSAGSFFSGGVDSYYTLIKNSAEIKHSFYVHGFILTATQKQKAAIAKHLAQIEQEFIDDGKQLHEAETNFHNFSAEFTNWAQFNHGSALAALGMLLSAKISKLFVASTHSYVDLFPYGSHALVDPLWSTEYLQIVHDGAEADRIKKILTIARDKNALKHLKVCNHNNVYNCSKCRKCMLTMIGLELAGTLKDSQTMAQTIDLKDFRKVYIHNPNGYARTLEAFDYTKGRKDMVKVRIHLKKMLKDYENQQLAKTLRDNLDEFFASEAAEPLIKDIKRAIRINSKSKRSRFSRK